MNKPCYTDYIRHAMRFYSRYLNQTTFKNRVEQKNWWACHNVISRYSAKDKDILVYIYGKYDTLADNVYNISRKNKIDQNIIWDMMKEFEKKVAIERGLWV